MDQRGAMARPRMLWWVLSLLAMVFASAQLHAEEPCPTAEACPVDLGLGGAPPRASAAPSASARPATAPSAPPPPAVDVPSTPRTLLFFWGVGCPHCEQAKPVIARLAEQHEGLTVESIEVREDEAGRARFLEVVERLSIAAPGVPTFVVGDAYLVGYQGEASDDRLEALVLGRGGAGRDASSPEAVVLPLVGLVDPSRLSLPTFTVLVGLIDGINPCAMWVLLVLLGILSHVDSRKRLLLFGGAFVVMSGVVYFLFMTVWVSLFSLMGLSRVITIALGVVVLGMGLINLKELVWFKKGVSLVIPDRVKPKLYRRMRGITKAASLPTALAGVVALAFFVNLIELGCTLGLPAVYTRVLTLRADLSTATRYLYLALYNVAYVIPLGAIVVVYAVTLHRMTLSERGAKVLKGVSGVLLTAFGVLLIVAPELLSVS